jgi:hypothetical protein
MICCARVYVETVDGGCPQTVKKISKKIRMLCCWPFQHAYEPVRGVGSSLLVRFFVSLWKSAKIITKTTFKSFELPKQSQPPNHLNYQNSLIIERKRQVKGFARASVCRLQSATPFVVSSSFTSTLYTVFLYFQHVTTG